MEQPDSKEQHCVLQLLTFSWYSLSSPPTSLLSMPSPLPQINPNTLSFTTTMPTKTSLSSLNKSHSSSERSIYPKRNLPRWRKSFLDTKALIFRDPTLHPSSNSSSSGTSSLWGKTQELGSLRWSHLLATRVRKIQTFCLSSWITRFLELALMIGVWHRSWS